MKIPEFKYHPDPIKTGAFSQGEYRKCDCCNESTNIWYSEPFYTAKDGIECLCPNCIANGMAASKFDGEFQDPYQPILSIQRIQQKHNSHHNVQSNILAANRYR